MSGLFDGSYLEETRQPQMRRAIIVLVILSTIAVVLRLIARRLVNVRLGWDDYLILLAQLLAYGCAAITLVSINDGLAKHIFAIQNFNLEKVLRQRYIFDLCYAVAITVIKFSILLFYDRIFPIRSFRLWAYAYGTFLALASVAGILVSIFPCRPIQYFWNRSIKGGQCVNLYTFLMAFSAITILTDLMVLSMPMPLVWKLKVPLRQKFALSLIFVLGGFVTVIGGVRMSTLHQLFSIDTTWAAYYPGVWSQTEVNIGIVCACLPIMRPIVRKIGGSQLISSIQRGFSGKAKSSFWSSKARMSTNRTTSITAEDKAGPFRRLDSSTRNLTVDGPQASKATDAYTSTVEFQDLGHLVASDGDLERGLPLEMLGEERNSDERPLSPSPREDFPFPSGGLPTVIQESG